MKTKRRILAVFLTVAMLLTLLPAMALAVPYATWEEAGNAAVEGVDYKMSDDNVFTVYTPEGLALVANYVNSGYTSFIGWTVELGNDIDLLDAGVEGYTKDTVNETNSWNPIGTFAFNPQTNQVTIAPFQGVFDGKGHKVKNMYMNVSLSNTGLFGSVFTDMTVGGEQVVIKNVTIEGADITGSFMANSFLVGFLSEAIITDCVVDETSVMTIDGDYVDMNGAFVGGAQTSGLNLGGEIYIENCTNNGTISGGMLTGGIAGATGQKIINCTNNGSISANFACGGIVGYYKEDGGIAPFEILDCVNNGSVTTKNGWAGGIVGQMEVSSDSSLIARCYNTGSITGNSGVGGIVGGIDNGQLEDCYNTGAISGNEASASYLGGIAGYLYKGSIANCYNIGAITNGKTESSGGVVGDNENEEIIANCFYLSGTAEADFGGSTEITEEQLAEKSTFENAGWDFSDTWGMSKVVKRPVLRTIPEASLSTGGYIPQKTLTFDTNGGSKISALTENYGKTIVLADYAPKRDGYEFLGWYKDKELTEKIEYAVLDYDMTVYAKWEKIEETVDYDTMIVLTVNGKTAIVNGKAIENDVAPLIVNSRTYTPARFVAEALGAKVVWDEKSKTVTITKDEIEIILVIDSTIAYVNGEAVKMDASAFIADGRTFTPARFVAENLGAKVEWNEKARTVTIWQ